MPNLLADDIETVRDAFRYMESAEGKRLERVSAEYAARVTK